MTKTVEVKTELENKGYKVTITSVFKNGIKKEGISVITGTDISPVFYPDLYPDNVNNIVHMIESFMKENSFHKVNTSDIFNFDKVKDKLRLCIQRRSEEDIPKMPYLDLEFYVRVMISDESTAKVSRNILESWGISEEKLFMIASENTGKLHNVIQIGEEGFMFAITVPGLNYGASAIGNLGVLEKLSRKLDSDLIIAPSSIHEIIVFPSWLTNLNEATELVKEVNGKEVDEMDRLSDHAYYYSRITGRITY